MVSLTMSHSLSNFFDGDEVIHSPTVEISKSEDDFLKDFSRGFYQKIIDINDINVLENILLEWIKNIDKNTELIFELMKNHEQSKFWFSSIIGFFYQLGISCEVDRNKALELYLSAVSIHDDEFLDKNFIYLHLLK